MGRSIFLSILLILALLSLSLHQGHGRRVKVLNHYGGWHSSQHSNHHNLKVGRETMEMVMVMDYKDPVANVNPRSGGGLFIDPPTPSPPKN